MSAKTREQRLEEALRKETAWWNRLLTPEEFRRHREEIDRHYTAMEAFLAAPADAPCESPIPETPIERYFRERGEAQPPSEPPALEKPMSNEERGMNEFEKWFQERGQPEQEYVKKIMGLAYRAGEQESAKRQEEFVAMHIKGGALDGCICEPCISSRGIAGEAVKKALEAAAQICDRGAVREEGLSEHEILARMIRARSPEAILGEGKKHSG